MELREYYKILKNNFSILVTTIAVFLVIAYAWTVRVSQSYIASVALNISRNDIQSTADYRYDQYYRIEADEKFSDTVEQLFRIPGVAQEIFSRAQVNKNYTLGQLRKSFKATKLSPELVEVHYTCDSKETADKISEAIASVVSERVKSLNKNSSDDTWFSIIPSNYIVSKNDQNIYLNLGVAFIGGLLVGILLAFFKHYLTNEEQN